jgi:chorismate mutase
MMCNQEIPVPGRLERAIRVMLQLNTDKRQDEIRHVYLRGAVVLRPDLVSAQ